MQYFGDADYRNLVIIRHEIHSRLGHAWPTHAKNRRTGACAQSGSKSRGVHVARRFAGREQYGSVTHPRNLVSTAHTNQLEVFSLFLQLEGVREF
jgi:hypothetical protein